MSSQSPESLSSSQVLTVLDTLGTELSRLNPKQSATTLSHYRTLPLSVSQSYDLLKQGAQLVHATSTKYTLLGKIDMEKANELAGELVSGCQLIATACLALFDESTGTCRSTRHHVRKASRSVLLSVHSLVEVFWNNETLSTTNQDNQLGAQKTGVVWQHCNVILEKKLPLGNRSSIRRDLLTFTRDCNETYTEFQEMVDMGPCNNTNNSMADDSFEDFLEGGTDQYSESEWAIASAALSIVKCTRGCLNVSLQAVEGVNEQEENQLQFVNELLDVAVTVGEGVTDFASCLYPPLNVETLTSELSRQCERIRSALALIVSQDYLPSPVLELAGKIRAAIEAREQEVKAAIYGC